MWSAIYGSTLPHDTYVFIDVVFSMTNLDQPSSKNRHTMCSFLKKLVGPVNQTRFLCSIGKTSPLKKDAQLSMHATFTSLTKYIHTRRSSFCRTFLILVPAIILERRSSYVFLTQYYPITKSHYFV